MWSPKSKKNGNFNQFYENMRLVDSGDVVFAYYSSRIQKVGVVLRPAVTSRKPTEFGTAGSNWSDEGWLVPVEWHDVLTVIRPREIIQELLPVLPEKYSPLNPETGDGLQAVYLASVPEQMASILFKNVGIDQQTLSALSKGAADDGRAVASLEDQIEKQIQNDTKIDSTERTAISKARRGQGRFRANAMSIEPKCRLTGVTDPRLLRAGHIKPWWCCANNHERLDGYNGLLLAPSVDHLFNEGYVTFSDDGDVLVSPKIDPGQLKLLGIDLPKNVGPFQQQRRFYLEFHRQNVFMRESKRKKDG